MKRYIKLVLLLFVVVGCSNKSKLNKAQTEYLKAIDANYAYDFALKLEKYHTNKELGFRNAGSQAEIEASKMIAKEMKSIGLEDVLREEINVDSFSFNKANLTYLDKDNEEVEVVLGGYPTHLDTQGIEEYTIVDGKQGTYEDLKDLDIKDKFVLISINQRDNWWVNWPVFEASLKGAAGVLVYQDGGYGETSNNALNSQDMIGPASTPALSISKNDAKALKKAMKQKDFKINLEVESIIKPNSKAYNVSGKIVGKNPDEYIIISSHYDVYYKGFQDNNMAVSLSLAIAKGLIDSKIQPEKTIIFISHAAEEWGIIDSHYDWSTGAYRQITDVHPEWKEKTFIDINFELPAYAHGKADGIASVYEYTSYLEETTAKYPKVKGVYPEGINVISGLRSWSDDYAYSLNGIPSLRNEFMDSTFASDYYHSQYDNKDTYNKKALIHHLQMYGLLTLDYDQLLILPFDFNTRLTTYEKSSGVDLKDSKAKATILKEQIDAINEAYIKADDKEKETLRAEYQTLNKDLLATFKQAQDNFARLTYEEEEILAIDGYQANITNLESAIKALEDNDKDSALNDYLLAVDNNWYAYSFSYPTFKHFTDRILNGGEEVNLWGNDRVIGHVDLHSEIQQLKDEKLTDYTTIIASLKTKLALQQGLYDEALIKFNNDISTLDEMISGLISQTKKD